MWVGLSVVGEGVCLGGIGMVDNVLGEACEEMKIGVEVVSLAAKMYEFVNRIDVAGNNASSKVEEVVGDKPKVEDLIRVSVLTK